MPIYEYRCVNCKRKVSIFWRTLSAVDESKARCTFCGSADLNRLVSKVRVIRGGTKDDVSAAPSGDDDLPPELAGLDENDPRSLGRFLRKMASETGEEMGPEFDEVVGRLEKGEDPEKIEDSMGDLFGDAPGGAPPGMDDDYGMGMGGMPEPPATEDAGGENADKGDPSKDKGADAPRRNVAVNAKVKKAAGKKTKSKPRKK